MAQINATATPITLAEAISSFRAVLGNVHTAVVACAVAHSALETGYWLHANNYNLGNAKSDGSDTYCTYACGEELPLASAQKYAADSPSLVTIVKQYVKNGQQYASVSFIPPHPMCRFRAYSSLQEGVTAHLAILRNSFPKSWAAMQAGDVELFARVLGGEHYYTADVNQYTARVSDVYDHVVKEMLLPVSGETGGQHLWRIVQFFAGCSIHHRHLDLRMLAAMCEDRPDQEMLRTTNCATSARWIYRLANCQVQGLFAPDEVMRAANPAGPISWLITAAKAAGALVPGDQWQKADAGWLLYYAVGNNAHVEWCGGKPDASGNCAHGGGGRPDNAITIASGDIRSSWSRPLVYLIDPAKMKVPDYPTAIETEHVAPIVSVEDSKPVVDQPAKPAIAVTGTAGIAAILAAILAYFAHC